MKSNLFILSLSQVFGGGEAFLINLQKLLADEADISIITPNVPTSSIN